MVQPTQHSCADQPSGLAECLDIPVVISHLIDELTRRRQLDKRLTLGQIKTKRLLAEDMQAMLERAANHLTVKARGCGHHNAVELRFRDHLAEIGVDRHTRVFVQDVQNILRGVTDRDEINPRMGVQYRLVRQTHLADAYEASPDHASTPNCVMPLTCCRRSAASRRIPTRIPATTSSACPAVWVV